MCAHHVGLHKLGGTVDRTVYVGLSRKMDDTQRLEISNHFIYRLSVGNVAIANRAIVASILDVERILVGDTVFRSSDEGAAVTLAPVMDDDALLLYLPPRPSVLIPSAGYTFVWESMVAGRNAPQYMTKYREGPERQDVIENHTWFDHIATEPLAGAFFSDVVD